MLVVMAAVAPPRDAARASAAARSASRNTLRTYRGLLRDRTFVGLVLVAGLAMAGLFGYVAGSSFVFQEEFGLNEQQFGLLFGAGRAVPDRRHPAQRRPAAPVRAAGAPAVRPGRWARSAGATLLVLAATETGGIVGVVAPLWTVLFAVGLAMPNAPAWRWPGTVRPPGRRPRCSARSRWASARSCRRWSGCFGNDAIAMGAVMTGGSVVALAVLLTVVRPWTLADLEG